MSEPKSRLAGLWIFFTSKKFWLLTTLFVIYWVAIRYLNKSTTNVYLASILAALAVGVIGTYALIIWEGMKKRIIDSLTQMALGICLVWSMVLLFVTWRNAAEILRYPWMRNHEVVGFYLYIGIIAAVFFLTAPRVIHYETVDRTWAWFIAAIAIAVFLTYYVFVLFYGQGFYALEDIVL